MLFIYSLSILLSIVKTHELPLFGINHFIIIQELKTGGGDQKLWHVHMFLAVY